jgi:mannose-6-phosphate isomerase-like protein (cupin superfamily)
VIFILEGSGTILEKDPSKAVDTITQVTSGHCLYCPKGHTHSLLNTSDVDNLIFYAVVPQQ